MCFTNSYCWSCAGCKGGGYTFRFGITSGKGFRLSVTSGKGGGYGNCPTWWGWGCAGTSVFVVSTISVEIRDCSGGCTGEDPIEIAFAVSVTVCPIACKVLNMVLLSLLLFSTLGGGCKGSTFFFFLGARVFFVPSFGLLIVVVVFFLRVVLVLQ